jgi:hypothetical protein
LKFWLITYYPNPQLSRLQNKRVALLLDNHKFQKLAHQ